MKQYSIETIIWEDHFSVLTGTLPADPDNFVNPTLSVGIVIDETKKVIILAHDIERYDERDDVSFTIIFKSCIIGRQKYGTIKIEQPRKEVVS